MLDRTRKRVGHGGESEVGGGRGEMGKISTYLDGTRQSFLIKITKLAMSGNT